MHLDACRPARTCGLTRTAQRLGSDLDLTFRVASREYSTLMVLGVANNIFCRVAEHQQDPQGAGTVADTLIMQRLSRLNPNVSVSQPSPLVDSSQILP